MNEEKETKAQGSELVNRQEMRVEPARIREA